LDRAENEYIVAYVWPFDPLTLTPGLDTKKFSEILRRNLANLANNTRHNIPLEIALQAVGAEYGVPTDSRRQYQMMEYMNKRQNGFEKTLNYLEEKEEK
jgi:hypothetical protein